MMWISSNSIASHRYHIVIIDISGTINNLHPPYIHILNISIQYYIWLFGVLSSILYCYQYNFDIIIKLSFLWPIFRQNAWCEIQQKSINNPTIIGKNFSFWMELGNRVVQKSIFCIGFINQYYINLEWNTLYNSVLFCLELLLSSW